MTEHRDTDLASALTHTADGLEALVMDTLGELVQRHLPQWRVPGFFAGHPVEPDVAADLAFTLAHLHDLGVDDVCGTSVPGAIETVLSGIDGTRTHSFFSYRVAESVARFGPLGHNSLVDGWSRPQLRNLEVAVDSTDWAEILDEHLPRNYAAVLARCETARRSLGIDTPQDLLDDLVARTRSMLGHDGSLRLDDSTNGVGRVDIYTVDVWLFTEPLAPLLGDLWPRGVAAATSLLEQTGTPRGAAVLWGRSTGALACALTIEMAALVLAGRSEHPEWTAAPVQWVRRLQQATEEMSGWIDGGLTTAHRNRNTYGYRGPFRRLQMTLDLLGKLAWSAHRIRSATGEIVFSPTGDRPLNRPDRGLIRLVSSPPASLWTDHDPHAPGGEAVLIPFVGATRSDYIAAPRRPGLYEVPVDSEIACWVPTVAARHRTFAPSGVPDTVDGAHDRVVAHWSRLDVLGDLDPERDPDHLRGAAQITYSCSGRSIEAAIEVELGDGPGSAPIDGIVVNVPEALDRPLRVELLDSSPGAALSIVETDGIDEWRSFWGELPRVHQIDLDRPTSRTFSIGYRVTPAIRVVSTAHSHHYDECLYGPLERQRLAVSLPNPLGPLGSGSVDLDDADVFHLHWPEWLALDDIEAHREIAGELAARGIPVVWTAHNLTPHDKRPDVHEPIYQLWARHADAVIHHSAYGQRRMRERYAFSADTRHFVVPHGHFGELYPAAGTDRTEAEHRLGLGPAALRVGILGAPREERDVSGFLEAVSRSTNSGIRVCCWSLDEHDHVPDDPRIELAEGYRMVDADTYGLRLAACDALALPFDPDGEMLATGVAADVIGHRKAALASSWEYLREVLGDAVVPIGATIAEMTAALDRLDPGDVSTARAATDELRQAQSWDRSAALTLEVLEFALAQESVESTEDVGQ